MRARGFATADTLDRKTQRLLDHLSLVGLVLEHRIPALERAEGKIGDLAAVCFPPLQAASRAGSNITGDTRAA